MFKAYDIKRVVRFFVGYIQTVVKNDSNNALQKYVEISKTYKMSEQIDGYTAKYEELRPVLEQMLSFCKDEVETICKNNKKCKVLDYGCGSGRYLALLKTYDLYGIDANIYTLEHFTQQKVPEAKLFAYDFTNNKDMKVKYFI